MKTLSGKYLNCKHCGTLCYVPPYRVATFQYCNRSCKALATVAQGEKACEQCGKMFSFIESRANSAKYCSTKCYNKGQRGRGKTTYECQHCHKLFLAAASTNRKFCSKACVGKEAKKTWKPAFTTVRKSMERRGMLTRCHRCGFDSEPRILGVHHKDRNRENNKLSNLEVLCPNCHSLEHMKHTPHGFTE